MAALPEDGKTAGARGDDLDIVAQPPCPDCGTVLRDDPQGYVCGSCGFALPFEDAPPPALPEFEGPSIRFG